LQSIDRTEPFVEPIDRRSTRPLVAICLATHEPRLDLLRRQLASIQAQSHETFVCVVHDDASSAAAYAEIERMCRSDQRFSVQRNEMRLGFYGNFERALLRVPPEADAVALCDQDDVWHADKLETLLTALRKPSVTLAYSDMTILTAEQRILAPTYWTDRKNNFTDLGSLLLTNTVTGAASLFTREVLESALPFPRVPGSAYHDHWLACVALALGEIAFIDRSLLDYVQHGGNVVGRHEPPADELKGGLVNAIRRFAADPRRRARNTLRHARRYYEHEVVPREQFARTLERRLAGRMTPEKARIVRRAARLSSSPSALAWLLARSARDVRGESETLGIENQLIKGILWHKAQRLSSRAPRT
jgi:O-antigen biosynthesis protein